MQDPALTTPKTSLSWLWALLPLLLAAALSIPLLDVDAFNGDEPASLIAAGVLRSGPLSLEATWSFITNSDPHQAYGWPVLLAIWGYLVGWSEVAVRALSLFFGMLALAWVYRTGRDLLAPRAGLLAALLLSTSGFFLAYMIHARAFTLIALCSTLCIWSYWRIVLNPRPTGMGAPAGLMLGSVSLLYLHYFSALFLPALGLFHLLFVPKNRRWWRPVLLLGLAALLATVQLPGFLQGLERTVVDGDLHNRALSATALLSRFVRFMTNGLVAPSPPFSELLLLALPLVLALVTLQGLRGVVRLNSFRLVAWMSLAVLAVMISINALIQMIEVSRIRYLMPLWPLTALLAGAGLRHLARRHPQIVTGLLALWLILGVHLSTSSNFRYELGYFIPSEIHRIYRALGEQVPETNLLMIDKSALWTDSRGLYSSLLHQNFNALPVEGEFLLENIRETYTAHPFIWLLYPSRDGALIKDLTDGEGLAHCELAVDEWGFALERLARSGARCASDAWRLEFENNIRLTWSGISLREELLSFEAGLTSVDDYLLASYSLAVHVINPRNGERVAQGDVGVGPGAIATTSSEIDISALPPGDYEVRVALYDWQTGARLSARDLETDAISDIHTLHHFQHN